jgi:hypothetical protein
MSGGRERRRSRGRIGRWRVGRRARWRVIRKGLSLEVGFCFGASVSAWCKLVFSTD